MKLKNQKGFGTIELLIIVVLIGLLAGAGWFVYNRQKNKSDTKVTTTTQLNQKTTAQTNTESETTPKKIDTTIHTVDIKLQTAADITKLPEYTPASFKTFMLDILKKNKYENNGDIDVITQYSISKISQVNITGGIVPVDKNGNGQPGGAPVIWVLTPAEMWEEETLNGPACKSKNGGLIYEEFVKECFTNPNADTWVKNPNGSIQAINN